MINALILDENDKDEISMLLNCIDVDLGLLFDNEKAYEIKEYIQNINECVQKLGKLLDIWT